MAGQKTENILDLSDEGQMGALMKAAGTAGDPFVPGEARETPWGIALETDFVPTPTTKLPPGVQLAAVYGQSPHLYNMGSFLYPFGFFAGIARGLWKYRGLEAEAEKRAEKFRKEILNPVYQFLKAQIDGAADEKEEKKESEENKDAKEYFKELLKAQKQYETQREVPGQMGGGASYALPISQKELNLIRGVCKRQLANYAAEKIIG